MLKKINIAVIGATGYTGLDLINLLSKHPKVSIKNLCATKNLGKKITGDDMANFLNKYAEIGFEYVTKVKNMIEKNQLSKYENSILTTY